MATYREAVEELSNSALKEGRVFRIRDELTNVATGKNYLYVESPADNAYRVLVDLAKFYSSDNARVTVFKDVSIDTDGTSLNPVNFADSQKAEAPQFKVFRDGSFSGLVTDSTTADHNVVDTVNLETQSGGFLSSVGEQDGGDFVVLGEQGGNLLIEFDNTSGSSNDRQETKLRVEQERP